MIRFKTTAPLLVAVVLFAACDSSKESRPVESASKTKTAPDANKDGDAKAVQPAKVDPATPAPEPTKAAEPAKAAPAAEPCLVTVTVDDGSAKTKPRKADKVTAMTAMTDDIRAVISSALDGEPTALAPLTKDAVMKLGKASGDSATGVSIAFEDGSATYSFDGSGRMTKVEFDPVAETRNVIFAYHYTCDEALIASVSGDDAGTTAPPEGIPADWHAIEGDPTGMETSGTFFVPKGWVLEGKAPDRTARPTTDSGVHCFLNMPRELEEDVEANKQLLATAKADAKKHAVTDSTVERDGTELYLLEYSASGDGTLVLEAWSMGEDGMPSGVTCADESGEKFKGVRKDVDLVVRSFIPFRGERG